MFYLYWFSLIFDILIFDILKMHDVLTKYGFVHWAVNFYDDKRMTCFLILISYNSLYNSLFIQKDAHVQRRKLLGALMGV